MEKTIKKETPDQEVSDKQIIVQENGVVNFDIEKLISQAVTAGTSVEGLERLLAMRKELKAEWAKEQFNKSMAKFQSECPVIVKDKDGGKTKTGFVAYKYAPLESIVAQTKGLIQQNGFSYAIQTQTGADKVKVTCIVNHEAGHSESSDIEVPLGTKTEVMSAPQVVAAALTFAKRYAFCNAFGILTGDEDNDGDTNKFVPPVANYHAQATTPIEHRGIDATQSKLVKPSDKQMDMISTLMKQKGYTKEDVIEWGYTKLHKDTASELIKELLQAKSKIVNGQVQPVYSPQQKKELEEIGNEVKG